MVPRQVVRPLFLINIDKHFICLAVFTHLLLAGLGGESACKVSICGRRPPTLHLLPPLLLGRAVGKWGMKVSHQWWNVSSGANLEVASLHQCDVLSSPETVC